jgi:urease gamma subunit
MDKSNKVKDAFSNSSQSFDNYNKESDFKKIYEHMQKYPEQLLTTTMVKKVLGKTNNFSLIARTLEHNGFIRYVGNVQNVETGRLVMSYAIIDALKPFTSVLHDLPKVDRDLKAECEKVLIQIVKNICTKKMDKDLRKNVSNQIILITEKMADGRYDSDCVNLLLEGFKQEKIIDILKLIKDKTNG